MKNIQQITITIGLVSLGFIISYYGNYLFNLNQIKLLGIYGVFLYFIFIILSLIVIPCMTIKIRKEKK